jgi:hypothetical protein
MRTGISLNEPLSVYLPAGFIELELSFVIPPLHIKGVLGTDWLERNAAIMSFPENRLYVPTMNREDRLAPTPGGRSAPSQST